MKICAQCSAEFPVYEEDRKFLDMLSPVVGGKKFPLPEPTLCPFCRQQKRFATRNERTLYRRTCDATGKQIISCFPQNSDFTIYDNKVWWSDFYDPLQYGRDFDFKKPFFEQFLEFRNSVPRFARIQQEPIENCDYANAIGHSKNCYLMSSTDTSEDCCYGMWVNFSRNCIDNYLLHACEYCYECVNCRNCNALKFSSDCTNCRDSSFVIDCIGCQDLFGCTSQRNKKHMIFNVQLTREAYAREMAKPEYDIRSSSATERHREKMISMKDGMIVKSFHGVQLENCSGDYLRNCKNTHHSFDCDDTEDMRYSAGINNGRNSMDHTHWGTRSELIYNSQACGYDVFHLICCFLCSGGCRELFYSDHCFHAKNCFACSGLKSQEYCIMNKQYSQPEYEKMVSRIIEHMMKTGEWGEFFPVQNSPYAYNETIAQEYYPLSREEIIRRGWKWKEIEEQDFSHISKKIPAEKLPDSIENIPDDILNWAVECAESKRLFKIQKPELDFYRKTGIAVPRLHPDIRHRNRFALRNPRVFYDRTCMKCNADIETTYSPERRETVYCEKCYLGAVY